MDRPYHVPVLLNEAVGFLVTDPALTYVDGTVGGGGHAEMICRRLTGSGRLICFDADEDALRHAAIRLGPFRDRVQFVHGNFRALNAELDALSVRSIGGLLLDLGVSSFQLDEEGRGFSFRRDERLDMRMDRRQERSAWDIVNGYDEKSLADLLWRFGEERKSRKIAARIVASRVVNTTGELKSIVGAAVGARFLTKTLARIFQALRIEVNAELRSLEQALTGGIALLSPGGRIVVISYHSLEDRIVKERFRKESSVRGAPVHPYAAEVPATPRLRLLTKKPVEPDAKETGMNPRARSAKLRAAEKLPL